ncbi:MULTISPECIES: hypothetical protein [unclassified Ruegeria]|uniref:hypothetical protein n=1 Tax=unclassified Ruegeria TaxID=2625375 RepID=UPI001489D085|nr:MULTISPECIES: hypothetical protein [unclassified Ruegeria]
MTQIGQTGPDTAARKPAYEQLCRDNLVSLILVGEGDTAVDEHGLRSISRFANARFDYHELIIIASDRAPDWDNRLRQIGQEIEHLRVLSVDRQSDYEDMVIHAMHHAIGDYILCMAPDAASEAELDQLLDHIAGGEFDVVKAVFDPAQIRRRDRVTASVMAGVMRLVTGQQIESFQARAFVLTRTAMSRLEQMGDILKFFRILDLSAHLSQKRVFVSRPPRRRFLAGFSDKARLSAELVSLSSERLVRSFALVCLCLSLLSILATLGAIITRLVLQDVAPGWASLAVLFSALFAANFGVLSAICLGLLQLLRQGRRRRERDLVSEISGGDLYHVSAALNVEGSDESK